jgi:hypothetical protein
LASPMWLLLIGFVALSRTSALRLPAGSVFNCDWETIERRIVEEIPKGALTWEADDRPHDGYLSWFASVRFLEATNCRFAVSSVTTLPVPLLDRAVSMHHQSCSLLYLLSKW